MTVARSQSMLEQLEAEARDRGLLLRLQVGRPLGLWSLRLVVAQQGSSGHLLLLGEMKGWAYSAAPGLQLDTYESLIQKSQLRGKGKTRRKKGPARR